MKKAKKRKWMILLSILTILIVPLNKVNALIITEQTEPVGDVFAYTFGTAQDTKEITLKRNKFQGQGEGQVIATFRTANISGSVEPIHEIRAFDNNAVQYECDIGNVQNYIDNTTQFYVITAVCSIDLRGTNVGLRGFYLKRAGASGSMQAVISEYITFTQNNNESAAIVSAINTATQQQITNNNTNSQAMQTAISQAITNATATTNNKVQALIDQDLQEWNEWKNTDISNDSKQQPDQQNYDSVHNFENGIFTELDDPNILSLIDLGIDPETNNWIWNTMTSIFNANVRVMSMVISVLTLGLAKFLMGR